MSEIESHFKKKVPEELTSYFDQWESLAKKYGKNTPDDLNAYLDAWEGVGRRFNTGTPEELQKYIDDLRLSRQGTPW